MTDDLRSEEQRALDAKRAGEYLESARLFEPLAAFGSEMALLVLGCMHRDGRLGPPDLDKAIALFERAAGTGSARAKVYLGAAWKKKGDLQCARAIFLDGAEQGDTPCMCRLGRMLVRGEGGETDLATGVAWLTRAADSGHVFARRELFCLEIRNSPSLLGRFLLFCKLVRFVRRTIPGLARNPYSPNYR